MFYFLAFLDMIISFDAFLSDCICLQDQSHKGILFLGKTADGKVEVHEIHHSKQLMELKNTYNSFKMVGSDDF